MDGGLAGRVLALASRQDLPEDYFIDFACLDLGPLHGGFQSYGTELVGGQA